MFKLKIERYRIFFYRQYFIVWIEKHELEATKVCFIITNWTADNFKKSFSKLERIFELPKRFLFFCFTQPPPLQFEHNQISVLHSYIYKSRKYKLRDIPVLFYNQQLNKVSLWEVFFIPKSVFELWV